MRKQTRRRCLSATALLAALLLAGCSSTDLRRRITAEYAFTAGGYVDDAAAWQGESPYAATEEERTILAGMEEVLSNDKAALYLGQLHDLALLDKATGAVWFSNRALYEEELVASDADRSQLAIQFYDSSDTLTTMTSYPTCCDGVELDQVRIEKRDGAVSVRYTFGTLLEDLVISPAFSAGTYDRLIGAAQAKIDAGELTVMQVGRFKMGYIHLVYDELSPTDQSIYAKQYPKFPEIGEMYAMKPNLTNLQKREVEEVTLALGLDKEAIAREVATLGELAENQDQSPYFEVQLDYRLDGRDLLVSLDPRQIVEQEQYQLTRIELLGGLGAVSASDGHYLFVPDGSGAILDAVQDNPLMRQVSMQFYGSDFGVNLLSEDELSPECVFPVFGLKDTGRALFAVAESGEALAGLTAGLPDDTSPYARIAPWYQYRVVDSIDLNGMGDTDRKNVYSSAISQQPLVLRYHPLYGEDASYSGMARYYRRYLIQRGLLPAASRETETPLDIDLLGAYSKQEMKYGFPVTSSLASTTFAQAEQIIGELREKGVASPDIQYIGIFNGGLDFSLSQSVRLEKVLGGTEGFKQLLQTSRAGGLSLYPSVDLSRVYRKGNGLDQRQQLSRYLSKEFSQTPAYLPADGTRSSERVGYQISAAALGTIAQRFADSYAQTGCTDVYLSSIGSYLSGDYHEGDEVDREESKLLTMDALQAIESAGYRIKLDSGNAYVLPYASALTNVPVGSRSYTLYSETVPFVGMVLHGSIGYSGPAINRQGDQRQALLQSLESGAGLHYMLMKEDSLIFAGTAYTEYYSLSAGQWLDTIAETWARAKTVYDRLAGATMEEHKKIGDQVYECRYSNGVSLLINYGETDAAVGGQTVKAGDYALKGGDTDAN